MSNGKSDLFSFRYNQNSDRENKTLDNRWRLKIAQTLFFWFFWFIVIIFTLYKVQVSLEVQGYRLRNIFCGNILEKIPVNTRLKQVDIDRGSILLRDGPQRNTTSGTYSLSKEYQRRERSVNRAVGEPIPLRSVLWKPCRLPLN